LAVLQVATSACLLLGFSGHPNTGCWIGINQTSVYGINHDLVNALHQSTYSLKRPTCFYWLKGFNQSSGFDLLNRDLTDGREYIFLQ
jgi:hypothetical protein